MRISSFNYLSRQGVKNLWTNRMMTLASVGVLTACLLIVGVAVLLTENLNSVIEYVESQNEFKAFLYHQEDLADVDTQNDTSDWDSFCASVVADLQAVPNVESVEFVSKAQGMEQMKEQLGDNAVLLEGYEGDENPLNDSVTIRVKDLSLLKQTVVDVSAVEGIETVSAANEVAETLTDIRHIVNISGWALIAALVAVSLVIIMNTIRATIFTRRKELNIMRYVGATKAFIHLPFLVEGFWLGMISAAISYGIIWGVYVNVLDKLVGSTTNWLNTVLENIIPFPIIALPLAIFFVGSGVLIGVVGSAVSIRNHIKV